MTSRAGIEIEDAIASAAGGYTRVGDFDTPLAITRRISGARGVIVRFLENVPDDASVLELREAIEAME